MFHRIMCMVAIIAITFAGCVVNKNESAGTGNQQAPSLVRTVAETALNWKGTSLAASMGALAWYRGRRWKKAYHATADEIEKRNDKDLKKACAIAHQSAGVHDLAKKQAKKYKRKDGA